MFCFCLQSIRCQEPFSYSLCTGSISGHCLAEKRQSKRQQRIQQKKNKAKQKHKNNQKANLTLFPPPKNIFKKHQNPSPSPLPSPKNPTTDCQIPGLVLSNCHISRCPDSLGDLKELQRLPAPAVGELLVVGLGLPPLLVVVFGELLVEKHVYLDSFRNNMKTNTNSFVLVLTGVLSLGCLC